MLSAVLRTRTNFYLGSVQIKTPAKAVSRVVYLSLTCEGLKSFPLILLPKVYAFPGVGIGKNSSCRKKAYLKVTLNKAAE